MKKNKKIFIPFYKLKAFYVGGFKRNKFPYIKGSIFAILVGIIISFIVIGINGANPFSFTYWVFKISFNQLFLSNTLVLFALYVIGALSLSIGFKAGIFNIGIPGQMMFAGCLTIILGIKFPNLSQAEFIIFALLISILSGIFIALITGILKAFLNINEVVTTIMMNWIVFYFLKWVFLDKGIKWGIWDNSDQISQQITNPNFSLTLGNNEWILPILISLVIIIGIWFLFFRTSLGYKMKSIGLNKNASKYAGINDKTITLTVMTISGAIAGVMGMIYYIFVSGGQITFNIDQIPTFGLDCMSVSLIAFNNPIGIFFISFLWGILNSGTLPTTQLPEFHISKNTSSLIFGIIIYCATISIIFINWKPWIYIKKYFINIFHFKNEYISSLKKYKQSKKEFKLNIKESKKEFKLNIKNLNQNDDNFKKLKIIAEYDNKIKVLKQKIVYEKKYYKKSIINNLIEYENSNINKIKKDYKMEKVNNLFNLINEYTAFKYHFNVKKISKTKNNENKKEFKSLKNEFIKNVKDCMNNFHLINKKIKYNKQNKIKNFKKESGDN